MRLAFVALLLAGCSGTPLNWSECVQYASDGRCIEYRIGRIGAAPIKP